MFNMSLLNTRKYLKYVVICMKLIRKIITTSSRWDCWSPLKPLGLSQLIKIGQVDNGKIKKNKGPS